MRRVPDRRLACTSFKHVIVLNHTIWPNLVRTAKVVRGMEGDVVDVSAVVLWQAVADETLEQMLPFAGGWLAVRRTC